MEKDQSSTKTSDEHSKSQAAVVRWYECSFCKRGFTNAQALGGHMNIHRKDKAKLKQPSTPPPPPPPPLYIPNPPSFNSPIPTNYKILQYSEIRSSTEEKVTKKEAIMGEFKKLPLFDETPTSIEDDQGLIISCVGAKTKEGLDLSSSRSELDLELRLGTEPAQNSSASGGAATKKFF